METNAFDPMVHLHTHFDFSPLDGAQKIKTGFARAAMLGQPALAITDHGSQSGHYDAWKEGAQTGVKPLLGVEAYIAPDGLTNKSPVFWGTEEQRKMDVGGRGKATHQTMLALNPTGLRNLYRMQYIGATQGFYGYPRFDLELMAQHSEGVLVTSGCAGSAISVRIRLGQWDEAVKYASQMKDVYGENFFIETMDHHISEPDLNDLWLNARLVKLAKLLNIPVVATNDAHYCESEDSVAHDAFLAIQTHSTLDDPKRFRFNGAGYHLKSAAEMEASLRHVLQHAPDAIKNTLVIAERVESYDSHFAFKSRMPHLPEVDPDMEDDALRQICERALEERFGNHPDRDIYELRMNQELDVIGKTAFPGYHLVLSDVQTWAKNQGIRMSPCRGSAGGSLVCYLINITGVDPVLHNLPFERYLNLDRVSMPDIDTDYEITRRSEVVEYTKQRFGHKNVVKILTLGTIKAKAALKDATRLLGYDFGLGNRLTQLFPAPVHGFVPDLDCIFNEENTRYGDAKHLRAEIEANPAAREIYELAVKLEGLIRNFGVHAAGLIVSSEPLDDIIPLRLPTGKDKESETDLVTGFDAPAMEPMGLIKYDYLGLENLTTINIALAHIERLYGKTIVLEELGLDDAATYRMLAAGNSRGVFQFDSPGMRSLLKRMRPDKFIDLAAANALYRPGPMGADAHNTYADRKTGKLKVTPIHPEFKDSLEEILAPTYGVICFQETVMKVLAEVADYSLGQADAVRRIMGKKKPLEMAKLKPELHQKMLAKGYSEEAFEVLWEILVPFSAYSFCQAHSVGYAMVAYWTAYLKCHYPIAYFAALLSAEADDQEKLTAYLQDARENGVAILPPDVNESEYGFTPTTKGIRFGLSAIKGVGEAVITEVKNAQTDTLTRFYDNIPDKVNIRSLQCLIGSGALDFLGSRAAHYDNAQEWLERAKESKKALAHGDRPILRSSYSLPQQQSEKARMRGWESELIGTELTMDSLTIRPKRSLTEQEYEWISGVLSRCPGPQKAEFEMSGVRWSGQSCTPSDKLATLLRTLDALEVHLD